MPTSFVVNGPSGSFDFRPFIKPGERVEAVSITNPSLTSGVGEPTYAITDNVATIDAPS